MTLRFHNNEGLRACSPVSNGVHSWLHPTKGSPLNTDDWYEGDSWLKGDVGQLESGLSGHSYSHLIGEIDALLEDASFGLLEEDLPHMRIRRQACRCVSQPGVAELRLPDPVVLGNNEFLGRIYFSEPDCFEGLVSLHFHIKPKAENWRSSQDAAILGAQCRGDVWVSEYRKTQ